MSLTPTPEHEELRSLVRKFLDEQAPTSAARQLIDASSVFDLDLWNRMAAELGLQGITVPEEYGGAGAGLPELAIVLEEMGRVLLVAPYLSSAGLAVHALVRSGDRVACARWLPTLASGKATAALVMSGSSGGFGMNDLETRATDAGGTWTLTGVNDLVVDGDTASFLVVAASDGTDQVAWFVVESGADGLSRNRHQALDISRPIARVEFDGTPATRLAVDDGTALFEAVTVACLVMVASEQLGGATRCLDMAVQYAKIREQFGRPIGSFQAIKHKCADMLVEIEAARSALAYTAQAVEDGADDALVSALVTRVQASEAFIFAAKQNLQIHGGIGFTWEHDAHLFLRRAKSSELLFGSPPQLRRRIGAIADVAAS